MEFHEFTEMLVDFSNDQTEARHAKRSKIVEAINEAGTKIHNFVHSSLMYFRQSINGLSDGCDVLSQVRPVKVIEDECRSLASYILMRFVDASDDAWYIILVSLAKSGSDKARDLIERYKDISEEAHHDAVEQLPAETRFKATALDCLDAQMDQIRGAIISDATELAAARGVPIVITEADILAATSRWRKDDSE